MGPLVAETAGGSRSCGVSSLSSNTEIDASSISHDTTDIIYPSAIPFALMHVACVGVAFSGVTAASVWLCAISYGVRMFAIGAGYHRYFSHRSFSTSRWFQFLLAVLAQSSAQKSVLWWASKHRQHHLHSDTPQDTHSPSHQGFLYAHLGWIFSSHHQSRDPTTVQDLARFSELVWLDKFEIVPAVALAILSFVIAGWPGLFVGFVISTVLLFHATFAINSLAHTFGSRRYVTGDDSRNNLVLAMITFGEGWHNNHHAFQSSARQGFRWWEIDLTFYGLKALAGAGLVWNLKPAPLSIIRNEQRLGTKMLEKSAAKLASSFAVEALVASDEVKCGRLRQIQLSPSDIEDDRALAFLPTRTELRTRASAMFAKTCSLEEIVEKAQAIIAASLVEALKDPLSA